MADKELSQWFDINEQKPWEPGVYEVDVKYGFREPTVSYWNGEYFCFTCSKNNGYINAKQKGLIRGKSDCHLVKWRGLSSDQSAKPNPNPKGNRKVTRYVVMDPNYSLPTPVGTYACKENAQERKQAIPGGYILKIRFRTPEA